MNFIILCSVANLILSLSVMFLMLYLYSKAVNLGWKQIDFTLCQMKMSRGIHRYIYGINYFYEGKVYFKAITKKEYAELSMNRTGKIYAYIREFPKPYFNPDFEKCEFSLKELDWHERDKRRCFQGFLFMLIALEAVICMIGLQV